MQCLSITAAVGKGPIIPNLPNDVMVIKKLLNAQSGQSFARPLIVDSSVTPEFIARIEAFQKQVVKMAVPDGRVDPNGKTLMLLNHNQVGAAVQNSFTLSTQGSSLLKGIEKLRLKPYDDQTGKEISQWCEGATIGYGHLISNSEWDTYKSGITSEAADSLFNTDVGPTVRLVNRVIKVQLTQQKFDALVILAFNIGEGSFSNSSVVKMVNDPSTITAYPTLEAAWKAWNKSQGKVMKGLENRRQAEWDIYNSGVYKAW